MASQIRVQINTRRVEGVVSSDIESVYRALRLLPGVRVQRSCDIPPQCIVVNGRLVGVVDDEDAWQAPKDRGDVELAALVKSLRPKIVFKHQFWTRSNYAPGTVSAGYFAHSDAYREPSPNGLDIRPRPIDITARMRINGYRAEAGQLPWMIQRGQIVEAAQELEDKGLAIRYGRATSAVYHRELFDSKIGFNWRGFGMLTYRIAEYFRAGVVMITQPLGPDWPVREDVVLEDDVHCVFCDDPREFASVARDLLNDEHRLRRIRRNALDLWESKLCLEQMGVWYWNKLKNAV
jgi:hypothetical protein